MKKPYVGPAFALYNLPTHQDELANPRLCTLAHDLNNKLSVIIANCDVILTEGRSFNEETAERIHQIKVVATYMAGLIQKRQCPLGNESEATAAGA